MIDRRRAGCGLGAFGAAGAVGAIAGAGRFLSLAAGGVSASTVARASAAPVLLAWGPDGARIVDADGTRVLPAALPPVPTAGGVWTVDGQGLVARWQGGGGAAAADWIQAVSYAAGAPVHALTASDDGAHALLAHGERLTLLDAQARPLRTYEGMDLARRRRGRADWLFAHAGRRSLLAGWPALGELWEIPLDPDAPPIFEGLVHDYRTGESLPTRGHLGVRRAPLDRPVPRWGWADAAVPWVAGQVDDGVAIVHLDVRRRIATLPLADARPGAAALHPPASRREWWLPAGAAVHVVDTARWSVVAQRPLPGGLVTLQAAGAALWALAEGALQRWDGDGWRTRARLPGVPLALARDGSRGHWLVATADPPALHRLDADGRPVERLPLAPGTRIDGLAALG